MTYINMYFIYRVKKRHLSNWFSDTEFKSEKLKIRLTFLLNAPVFITARVWSLS